MTGEPYPDSKGESPVEDEAIVDINEKINDIRLSMLAQNESMHGYMTQIIYMNIVVCVVLLFVMLVLIFKI